MAEPEQVDLTTLTVELLSAFVSNNTIDSGEIAGLIQSTHSALAGINAPPAPELAPPEYPPAVTIRKSLGSRDHILSLIDGKPYKALKRHLSGHGLTPSEYRERYKLPADYPMVAPSYSEQRRDVATRLGLGRRSVRMEDNGAVVETKAVEPSADISPSSAPPVEASSGGAPMPKIAKTPGSRRAAKPAAKRVAKAAVAPPTIVDSARPTDPVEPAPARDDTETKPPKTMTAVKTNATKPVKRKVSAASKAAPKPTPAKRGSSKAGSPSASTE